MINTINIIICYFWKFRERFLRVVITRKNISFFHLLFFISIIQCCISFCCTTMWISSMYTHIPSCLDPPPRPPIPPIQVITELWAELPALYSSFSQLSVLHLVVYICYSYSLIPSHSPPCPPHVHLSILYICISIPALQIGSPVLFF